MFEPLQVSGTKAINTVMASLYHEGFFIRSHRAMKIAKLWLLFLQKYTLATQIVYRRGLSRFAVIPKLHMLHHGALRLLREASELKKTRRLGQLILWRSRSKCRRIG